jgi:tRNA(Ile)-lysidine synthase
MAQDPNTPQQDMPIGVDKIVTIMASIGAFEDSPEIAVAVSGGLDSMALLILLHEWASQRGGRVVGLTVDHGLRPDSNREACQVGTKPRTGVQARARLARRDLLLDWCRDAGVLHLALAHHQGDQVETFLMRKAKNSGPDGLAGMSRVREFPQARMIRPLLGETKSDLRAFLYSVGQDWIEDPSNSMEKYERVRVRRSLADRQDIDHIVGEIVSYGQARRQNDAACAAILARCVELQGAGYARLDGVLLCAEGDRLGIRCLSRLLFVIGGQEYGARRDKVSRAYDKLKSGTLSRGITLAGCRITKTSAGYLVCRENRNLPDDVSVQPGDTVYWDHRFKITVTKGNPQGNSCTLVPLGRSGWLDIIAVSPDLRHNGITHVARYSLPALLCQGRIVQVPYLGFQAHKALMPGVIMSKAVFFPREPLLSAYFDC